GAAAFSLAHPGTRRTDSHGPRRWLTASERCELDNEAGTCLGPGASASGGTKPPCSLTASMGSAIFCSGADGTGCMASADGPPLCLVTYGHENYHRQGRKVGDSEAITRPGRPGAR